MSETPALQRAPGAVPRAPGIKEGLGRAKGALAFILGLCLAAFVAVKLDRQSLTDGWGAILGSDAPLNTPAPPRPLTPEELAMARTAWAYFAAHTRLESGWPDSVAGVPATTIWDLSSYLLALPAAERLGLITRAEFTRRAAMALSSLERAPLFDSRLPNKVYNTITLEMTDYDGNRTEGGIGWSALDISRLLIALAALEHHAPELAPRISAVHNRFALGSMIEDGFLIGALRDPETGETVYRQEGRTGYEEYAARGAMLAALDATSALRIEDHGALQRIFDIDVLTDDRRGGEDTAQSYSLSEPYLLTAFEIGLDRVSRIAADRLFRAQKARFERTKIITALSEDHLDRAPYFLYATVIGNGLPWAVLDEKGRNYPALRTISTKAALGWSLLYEKTSPAYAAKLLETIAPLASQDGWYAGIYEKDGTINKALTANTNGVILEALHFRAFGPLMAAHTANGY